MKIVPHLSKWKNGILDVIIRCPILVIYENGFWEVLIIESGCSMEVKNSIELAEQSLLYPKFSIICTCQKGAGCKKMFSS
jgi:hypothetical protein